MRFQSSTTFGINIPLLVTDAHGHLMLSHELNNIVLINDLQQLLDDTDGDIAQSSFTGGKILLGGSYCDTIKGRDNNDVIHGEKWLSVRLPVIDANNNEIAIANSMTDLQAQMFWGAISPSRIRIVCENLPTTSDVIDIDIVVFSGILLRVC